MADIFRKLCAAAVAAFDGPSGAADTALLAHRVDEWLDRARAALDATPPPATTPAPELVPECARNWDSILSPSPGYELTDDAVAADGAQLVGGNWWAPVFGCDSLELVLTRIRERLERQQPRPVPVAERPWEREGWCDVEGRCWQWVGAWQLEQPRWFDDHATHTLPHDALPLPGDKP